jgi:pimeloyl-ACP methyl ester carboxylesterase
VQFQARQRAVFAGTGGRAFEAKLPALVLLHGGGLDHSVWSLQARYFAHHGHAVLALDLPGHGKSEGPPLPSIVAMADWVVGCLDALGIARARLVGHSMGAFIALETAAAAPERVEAIALLGVAARMPVHPDLLAAAAENRHLAPELITAWGYGRAAQIGGNPAPGLWMTGGGLSLLERSASGVLAVDLAACNDYDGERAASRVHAPALLLLGRDDRMTPPAKAESLIAALAKAQRVVLPAGHMLMIERPDAVTDALRDFLASLK